MARPDWLKQVLSAGNEFHYVKQTPWRHNLLNLSCLLGILGAIAAVMALGHVLNPAAYIPLASVLLGCLFFSVFVLVIHECSHCMFVLKRNREASKRLNHRIGTVAGNLLFTDYMAHWAREHTVHHLQPMDDVDRQDSLRFSGGTLVGKLVMLLIPGAALFFNPSKQYGFQPLRFLTSLMFFGSLAAAGAYWVHWQVAVAIVMSFNVTAMCTIHKIAHEHGSELIQVEDPYLRSRSYFYPLRWVFSPFRINYHFEHHANFNVPWYRLKAYHQRVKELVPEDLLPYFLTRGLKQSVQQIAGTRELPPEEWVARRSLSALP